MANAMAAIGKTTGPLGRAIKGLVKHIGEISTIAATFAAVLGGRLVIALASAALGIKGVSISLVTLRGAVFRTGMGALIFGAGELIYWFGRLVKGAGGFGEAMRLLKDVAIEVWERIKLGGKSLGAALSSGWARIKAGWLTMLANIQKTWTDFLHAMTRGIANIPGMDSAMLAIGNAAIMAGSAYYEMAATAEEARNAADGLVTSSREMAQAATAPLTSMQALRDAMRSSAEDGESGLAGTTTAAEVLSRAVTGAGGAARAAAEVAKTAWEMAADSLKDYATKAADVGKGIGGALVGAFTSAENAIGEFVKTGKLDFSSLVTSLLADMAKLSAQKFILGPLANALSGALGNLGGIFTPVLHAGGMVGGAAPQRMVPAMAFSTAPRMHSGGWAGLRPDEVPAILQKGERVLSRREASQYGTANTQNITINIQTRDAESFRQSRTQVSADIARAVAMGRRGM
jgi:lambda family phage tail tape measure protein